MNKRHCLYITMICMMITVALAAPVKRIGRDGAKSLRAPATRDGVDTNAVVIALETNESDSGFTQFVSTNPVVVPAQSQKVYDKYWMTKLLVNAADPAGKSTLVAEFVLSRDVTNELGMLVGKELMPGAKPKRLIINDVFLKASGDLNFAIAMEAVFRTLKESAVEAHVIE